MKSGKIDVLIADDHPIVVEGIKLMVQGYNMQVVATANDGRDALEKILTHKPDIAILDLVMPKMSGIEITRECRKKKIATKVILLTAVLEDEYLDDAVKSGVVGYVLKNNTREELRNAIDYAMEGKIYVSPLIGSKLLANQVMLNGQSKAALLIENLSAMEKKVLALLAMSKTSREIGKELCISTKTVQNHRVRICQKLDLKGANALLSFAVQNKSALK